MSNSETQKSSRGRLFWLIPVLEFVTVISFFAYGFSVSTSGSLDIVGMMENVMGAAYAFIVALIAITVMCFIPIFKSKGNMWIVFLNVITICSDIYMLS